MVSEEPKASQLTSSSLLHRHIERSHELRAEFIRNEPWGHVVIDDFLPFEIAKAAAEEFPKIGRVRGSLARLFEARSYGGVFGSKDPRNVAAMIAVTRALNDPRFTEFVESISGINGLTLDATYAGAGFHMGADGSYLHLHADHNTHPSDASRFRRLNVILYLHSEWQAGWNGDLELWDREAKRCEKRIEPRFNRCVIMGVDDTTFHGYGPLRLPAKKTRNALAAYYYGMSPATGQATTPHGTLLAPLHNAVKTSALKHRVRRAVLARVEKALLLLSR